jgi:hypothetical protein
MPPTTDTTTPAPRAAGIETPSVPGRWGSALFALGFTLGRITAKRKASS